MFSSILRPTGLFLLTALPALAEVDQGPPNVPEFSPSFENQTRAPEIADGTALAATLVAGGLENPWAVAVLPSGDYLVTERPGRLNLVSREGAVRPVQGVPLGIFDEGQGGLLDVALAEDFAETGRIFLTYAKRQRFIWASTALATGILDADAATLGEVEELFVQSPATRGAPHFGSRVIPQGGMLFVTTGDRGLPENAQDLRTGQGKVMRLSSDGSIPADNPFVGQPDAQPEIWSYGHRNVQGAAIHPGTGELWTLEHGPRGGDELNRSERGANFGWPIASYGEEYSGNPVGAGRTSADGVVEPRYYWDPVIAPGGFAFYVGDLLPGWEGDVVAASLNPGGIVRLKLDGETVTGEARYLADDLGRVRDVAVDADGALLVVTDDPDGGLYRVTPR